MVTGCKLFACEIPAPLRGAWQPCPSSLLPASQPAPNLPLPRRRHWTAPGALPHDGLKAAADPPLPCGAAGACRTALWELREALLHFIADLLGCTDLQTPRGAEAGLDFPRALCCTGWDPANAVRPSPAPAAASARPLGTGVVELPTSSPRLAPRRRVPLFQRGLLCSCPPAAVFLCWFGLVRSFFLLDGTGIPRWSWCGGVPPGSPASRRWTGRLGPHLPSFSLGLLTFGRLEAPAGPWHGRAVAMGPGARLSSSPGPQPLGLCWG